jgi:hypothetical protein
MGCNAQELCAYAPGTYPTGGQIKRRLQASTSRQVTCTGGGQPAAATWTWARKGTKLEPQQSNITTYYEQALPEGVSQSCKVVLSCCRKITNVDTYVKLLELENRKEMRAGANCCL